MTPRGTTYLQHTSKNHHILVGSNLAINAHTHHGYNRPANIMRL